MRNLHQHCFTVYLPCLLSFSFSNKKNINIQQHVNCLTLYTMFVILFLIYFSCYLRRRSLSYQNVISRYLKGATLQPVLTKSVEISDEFTEPKYPSPKVISPNYTFKQYIKYLYSSCIPYGWSLRIKFLTEMILKVSSSQVSKIKNVKDQPK